jgi:hypothetical protein
MLHCPDECNDTADLGICAAESCWCYSLLQGKEIKKVIFVPGKILNLIVPGK